MLMRKNSFRRIYRHLQLIPLLFYFSSATAIDQVAAVSMRHLSSLSLDELMNIQVMSVAKKYTPLSRTAAAIHVITQEDIRRSGVVSIPEALRLAPGVNVARIDANKWAISVRGFNERYSDKLLVLIDGREVYHPAFSGVLWDTRDLMLEDLDRIEVVRGPGATLWGSNAVNGVINVISKSSADTQGGRLITYAGSENNQVALRYGGEINEDAHYRIYAKYLERDSGARTEGEGQERDGQNMTGGGFRVDWQRGINNRLTLDGRYYNSSAGLTYHNPTLDPPLYYDAVVTDETERGGHISMDWKHTYSDASEHNLKVYYQHENRQMPYFDGETDNFHIEFNHHLQLFENHDIVWGAGYRYYNFETTPGLSFIFTPDDRHLHTYNVFIQDEIELVDDRFWLTLGSKLESTYFSGFNAQPSVRLLWTPDKKQTVWFAVSKALRTPAIRENDLTLYLRTEPGFVPGAIYATSNRELEPESLIAYEFGYRVKVNSGISVDITGFYNKYRELVIYGENVGVDYSGLMSPQPHYSLMVPPTNNMDAETYGVELAGNWQVSKEWRLYGSYSYLKMNLHDNSIYNMFLNEFPEELSPQQQFLIRSSYNLTKNTSLDFWLRYVDELPQMYAHIDRYVELDVRLSWCPIDSLELSLVGKNLLGGSHAEFYNQEVDTENSAVERSVYLKLDWSF